MTKKWHLVLDMAFHGEHDYKFLNPKDIAYEISKLDYSPPSR